MICLSLLSCGFFRADPCKDEPKKEVKAAPAKISLDTYIENSGSMDGYVKGRTQFKTDLYKMISSLKVGQCTLYYINKEILVQNVQPREFILNLSPATFKKQGGERAFSDIAEVIAKSMERSKQRVMLLASDFIFSPPGSTADVRYYLEIQEQDICNSMARRLQSDKDFGVVLLQGMSAYDGYYWNVNNDAQPFQGERPYYVLLAGKRNEIATLLHSAERSGTHFTQSYTEMGCTPVSYEIEKQTTAKLGTFHMCRAKQKHHIMRCKRYKRTDTFSFNVKADFSNLPLTSAYLLNTNNYVTNTKGYRVTAVSAIAGEAGAYRLTLTATDPELLTAMPCEVKLKKALPAWIGQSNDPTGLRPLAGKTFGLSSMAEGIQKAFENTSDCYACLTLYIEN